MLSVRVCLFTIVPMVLGAQAPRPLVLTREVRIDGVQQQFSEINQVAIGPKGVLAVPIGELNVVRFFGAKGEVLGEFGHKGSGPNENLGIGQVGWKGEVLWFSDPGNSRVQFVSPDRHTGSTIPAQIDMVRTGIPVHPISLGTPVGFLSDGAMLVATQLPPSPISNGLNVTIGPRDQIVARLTPAGQFQGVVRVVPFPQCVGERILPVACQVFTHDISSDASRLVMGTTVHQDGAVSIFRLVQVTGKGDTVFSEDFKIATQRITARLGDSLLNSFRHGTGGPPPPWKVPDYFLPVVRVVLGTDGTTFVQLFGLATTRSWWMIDPGGNLIGAFDLPKKSRVVAGDVHSTWVVEEDDDGIPSLAHYLIGDR